jgi:hypothetical protein
MGSEHMAQARKLGESEVFWQKLVSAWEDKRQRGPFWTWDGSYRWFRSENVIPLERYRDAAAINRIKINLLSKIWRP